MTRSRKAFAALCAFAFIACDDSPAEPDAGQYDVSVTGDMTQRLRGNAWFGADEGENGEPVFGVVLGDLTSEHVVVLAKDGAGAPATGQYMIREPGSNGAGWDGIYIIGDDELDGLLVADSGRITITESSANRLKGTLKVYAAGLLGEIGTGMSHVLLEGSFDAKPTAQPTGFARSRAASAARRY